MKHNNGNILYLLLRAQLTYYVDKINAFGESNTNFFGNVVARKILIKDTYAIIGSYQKPQHFYAIYTTSNIVTNASIIGFINIAQL